MKVVVNKDNCIGCGACAAINPNVFKINEEDGLSEVICEDFSKVDEDTLMEAVESCPTSAIEKTDE